MDFVDGPPCSTPVEPVEVPDSFAEGVGDDVNDSSVESW